MIGKTHTNTKLQKKLEAEREKQTEILANHAKDAIKAAKETAQKWQTAAADAAGQSTTVTKRLQDEVF
jgi:hypothetical protein